MNYGLPVGTLFHLSGGTQLLFPVHPTVSFKPHFTDEETETEKLNDLPNNMQVAHARDKTQTQVCGT